MRRFVMTVVALSVMALLLMSVAQARSTANGKGFIGIWQGISDGGVLITLDISDIDGQLRFRANFDFSPICNEPGEEGRLLATPLTPVTINADGDLIFNESLTCSLTGRVIAEDIETTLRLINDHTLLDVRPGIPFHRVSHPPNR